MCIDFFCTKSSFKNQKYIKTFGRFSPQPPCPSVMSKTTPKLPQNCWDRFQPLPLSPNHIVQKKLPHNLVGPSLPPTPLFGKCPTVSSFFSLDGFPYCSIQKLYRLWDISQPLRAVIIPLFVSRPAGPLGGVMCRAGQSIMDGTTNNLGPLVVPAANFAVPLDGQIDVNIGAASRGCGREGPSPGF